VQKDRGGNFQQPRLPAVVGCNLSFEFAHHLQESRFYQRERNRGLIHGPATQNWPIYNKGAFPGCRLKRFSVCCVRIEIEK
jgi:hypothetical protein